MPKRHASSHALATLVTMLAATVLATWLRAKYHVLMNVFDGVSLWLLEFIPMEKIPLEISQQMLTNILFATVLSGIWGVGFYFSHRD